MTDTVSGFRQTLERETEALTSLCQLWTGKLVTNKTLMSEEVEVSGHLPANVPPLSV